MTDPIRAALERLIGLHNDDGAWGLHWDDAIADARAALTEPEPEVAGPTLDDIDDMCRRRDFDYYYDDWGPSDQDSRTVLQSMMNEVLARYGHHPAPPAAGEVGELVAWLRAYANGEQAENRPATGRSLTRAADLLEQRCPAPVPVSERLPGAGDCDEKGSCWLWTADDVDGVGHWSYSHRDWAMEGDATHWLPAHALPPTHHGAPTMTPPDIHAIAARRVHGLPDDWQPRIYGCLDRNLGFYLRGAVPIGTYFRGPRKGRPKWPPLGQLQQVVITTEEVTQARIWWENETGLCSHCGGSGQQVKSTGVNGTTYRECVACVGTGKALHTRGEPAP